MMTSVVNPCYLLICAHCLLCKCIHATILQIGFLKVYAFMCIHTVTHAYCMCILHLSCIYTTYVPLPDMFTASRSLSSTPTCPLGKFM